MFRFIPFSKAEALPLAFLVMIGLSMLACVSDSFASQNHSFETILDLIYRQKYDEAITQLEQALEKDPANAQALTLMATANLYHDLNFTKAQKEFQAAYKAGGGATFFVSHSHEKFTAGEVVDYCRGWLNFRKNEIEFVPIEGPHGFKIGYGDIEEFKKNRFSTVMFHIKFGGKSQNFRGRSNSDLEPLLIIALYKSFANHTNSPAAVSADWQRRRTHHEKAFTRNNFVTAHFYLHITSRQSYRHGPGSDAKHPGKTAGRISRRKEDT